MALFKEKNFTERRTTAVSAKQTALEKYRAKLADTDSPEALARAAERKSVAEARAVREAERAERLAAEKAQREADAKAAAEAAEQARIDEEARIAAEAEASKADLIAIAAAQKAARDRRYALRKSGKAG